jgi:glutamate racemase
METPSEFSDDRPIGVFDSGLGGLSVLGELIRTLPNESFLYLADSAYCPYGSRSAEEVTTRSFLITEHLMLLGAKMVVVACNTATAAAIDALRESYPIPFIGIEPAIKQAALHTASGKVGVLATRNTFQGRLFRETSARYASDTNVFIQPGDGLVEVVEENRIHTPEARQLLQSYILPMLAEGVDQIVLGCTHYPFLIPIIREIVPEHVVIHDPSPAVARQTARVLTENQLESNSQTVLHQAETTGDPDMLTRMIDQLNLPIGSIKGITLG